MSIKYSDKRVIDLMISSIGGDLRLIRVNWEVNKRDEGEDSIYS